MTVRERQPVSLEKFVLEHSATALTVPVASSMPSIVKSPLRIDRSFLMRHMHIALSPELSR
jgi:hypothetical protein